MGKRASLPKSLPSSTRGKRDFLSGGKEKEKKRERRKEEEKEEGRKRKKRRRSTILPSYLASIIGI